MTTQYLIKKISTCPVCEGSGIRTHPLWEEYWKSHDAFVVDDDYIEWFAKRGVAEDDIPDSDDFCHECNGLREIESEVDLIEALEDMGMSPRPEIIVSL